MIRVAPALCALTVTLATLPRAQAAGAETPVAWRRIAPGVEHVHLADGDGEALRFDLTEVDAAVAVPGPGLPLTAAHARLEHKALLAVNGGFFDTAGKSLGLRIVAGKTIIGLRPRVDWGVLLVGGGHARIVHSRDYVPSAEIKAAIQVGPRVLIDGDVPRLRPANARRTIVGVDAAGTRLLVAVTRTRLAADDSGRLMQRLGSTNALLLDGGPSTQLSAAIGDLTLDIEGGYAVPDLLLISARPR